VTILAILGRSRATEMKLPEPDVYPRESDAASAVSEAAFPTNDDICRTAEGLAFACTST
jgi:hypothetical protein